jgi:ABC-type bacteriocin/lantibiotic exporter with double-glycine peptidase domain
MVPLVVSLVLAAGLVNSGPVCSHWGLEPAPPAAHRVEGVALMEARSNWCGPEALAAVLKFHGEEVAPETIAAHVYLPELKGTLNLDLLLYSRKRGFQAWAGEGTSGDVRAHVAQDLPVIAMVRRGNPLASRNHFVIIHGYDMEAGIWWIDDGDGEAERWSTADFEREWASAGRWMLAVGSRIGGTQADVPSEGKTQ